MKCCDKEQLFPLPPSCLRPELVCSGLFCCLQLLPWAQSTGMGMLQCRLAEFLWLRELIQVVSTEEAAGRGEEQTQSLQ